MGLEDKFSANKDKAEGKAEELIGKVTEDDEKVAHGKGKQLRGDVKSAVEKLKDAGEDVVEGVKGLFDTK